MKSMGLAKKSKKMFGNFRGTVYANNDPLMLGRIQVEIYPMYVYDDPEMKENLPWAPPAMALAVGAGSGFGSFTVPDVGTNVWCFFEAGDVSQPVYFASAQDALKGLPPARTTDYPLTRLLRTQNGIQIKINDKLESEDIRVDHPSGSWVEFYPDGRVSIHTTTPEGKILIEADEADIEVLAKKGNVEVNANEGDILVTADEGDIEITASEGDVAVEATQGDITVDAGQGNITATALIGDVRTVAAAGTNTVEATVGNVILQAGGEVLVVGSGISVVGSGNMVVDCTGDVVITGQTVSINPP